MSQAKLINGVFRKNSRKMNTWSYDDGDFHSLTINLEDFDVEPDRMSFKPMDYPYFRVALLDKHLEETNAEKQPI